MQLGRSLPLFLDAHANRPFEAPSRVDYFLGKLAPDNPLLRRVPHPELTAHHVGGGKDLKICLQELRWLYDRRDLAEARRDLAAWLAKWSGTYPKLTS